MIDCAGTEVRTIDDLLVYVDPQWSTGGMCQEGEAAGLAEAGRREETG
jgi:hypothetical protein